MSILKIADLSFCETSLNNCSHIRGGITSIKSRVLRSVNSRLLFSIEEFEVEILGEILTENGDGIRYFYDNKTDTDGVIISKQTANGIAISGITEGNVPSGKRISSFAIASSRSL